MWLKADARLVQGTLPAAIQLWPRRWRRWRQLGYGQQLWARQWRRRTLQQWRRWRLRQNFIFGSPRQKPSGLGELKKGFRIKGPFAKWSDGGAMKRSNAWSHKYWILFLVFCFLAPFLHDLMVDACWDCSPRQPKPRSVQQEESKSGWQAVLELQVKQAWSHVNSGLMWFEAWDFTIESELVVKCFLTALGWLIESKGLKWTQWPAGVCL